MLMQVVSSAAIERHSNHLAAELGKLEGAESL